MTTTNKSGVTVGFNSLLALLFIALKLTGQIDWSWWLVLLPIWAPVVALLCLAFFCVLVYLAWRIGT